MERCTNPDCPCFAILCEFCTDDEHALFAALGSQASLVRETAAFLLAMHYPVDFWGPPGLRPPVDVLEEMVQRVADDPSYVEQSTPRSGRLVEAHTVLSTDMGDWR